MDIDASTFEILAELIRQDLHIAGKHDHVRSGSGNQIAQLLLSRGFRILRHRDQVEWQVVPVGMPFRIRMVGHDADNVGAKSTPPMAVQQVVQTMITLGHQHERLWAISGEPQ